jgi:hypothetical protein
MLADPVLAGIHQRGELGQVAVAFGVGYGGNLRRPRAREGRDEGAGPVPEPGVDDGGQVAGSGQVPLAGDLQACNLVELRGFDPLTSCMPCLAVSSDGIALGRITAGQTDIGV